MKIGLHDSDKTKFPNLALMKLSAWHKKKGDSVEFFTPFFNDQYDKIYSSKVFTWTNSDPYLPDSTEKGGTGYKIKSDLPDEIEHTMPDYGLYGSDYSIGFLTRGCIRKCSFCVVPEKEGDVRKNADIEEFTAHKKVVLLDNNVLSHDHGIRQIEKIAKIGLKIDFNQGMDARLVDRQIAKRLSKVKWIRFLRFSCDHKSMIPHIKKTVDFLSAYGVKPYRIFCYFLAKEINESLERVDALKRLGIDVFAMPYRDLKNNAEPSKELKKFARWVNHKAIFKKVTWDEYVGGTTDK